MLLHRISGEKTTKLPTLMSECSIHLLNPIPIPPCQSAIENMNWIRKGIWRKSKRDWAWILFTLGFLYSWRYGSNSNQHHSLLTRDKNPILLLFLVAVQVEFFSTPLSNHVPSRNQVVSLPLTTPFYSLGLCRATHWTFFTFASSLYFIYLILFFGFVLFSLKCIPCSLLFFYPSKKNSNVIALLFYVIKHI